MGGGRKREIKNGPNEINIINDHNESPNTI